MHLTWLGLIRRILGEEFGPIGGQVALAVLGCGCLVILSLPLFLIGTFFLVRRQNRETRALQDRFDRSARQLGEAAAILKDVSVLVRERLSAVPPPVNFGPESAPTPSGSEGDEGVPAAGTNGSGTTASGQGMYNYCPSCKSIQYIKFLRCQACGFHVLPGK